jgi:hypothetical protein
MNIQDKFEKLRTQIRDCSTLALLDEEGETVVAAGKKQIDEFDVKLFGAQMAVALAKEVDGKTPSAIYFSGENGSAAAKMLEGGYFLCLSFDKKSFKGYAERWLDEIEELVREEFF